MATKPYYNSSLLLHYLLMTLIFSPIITILSIMMLVGTRGFDYSYCIDITVVVKLQIIFQFIGNIKDNNDNDYDRKMNGLPV